MQRGVQTVAFYGELPVPGDIVLPRQRQHALEQRLKVRRRERTQLHEHPGAAAQIQIQPGDISHGPLAVDPPVFRPHILQLQPAHLLRHQGLQSE